MARRGTLRGSAQLRLRLGFTLIVVVLTVFGARLVQLQGLDPGHYAEAAAREGSVSVILPSTRGEIVDRNGEPLADSIDGLMIVADPSLTSPKARPLAAFLSRRLHLDYITTLDALRKKGSRFAYIAREVPAADARDAVAAAQKKGFVGLDTRDDPIREYPGGQIAANLIGFLGTPEADGAAHPLYGLERSFNSYLAGKNGEESYEVGGGGNRIPLGNTTLTKAVDGQTLHLTIDRDLQWYVQRVLQQTVTGAKGDSGEAIVLDSRTGEVLALADYPTYDASDPYVKGSEPFYQSAAINNVYEPGSVEKTLTLSALIDAGFATDKSRYKLPQELDRQDRPIHDYFVHPSDPYKLTLAGIIAKSSNIGTVMASDKFKKGQLRRYLTSFGLGKSTDLGMPTETKGLLPSGSALTSQVEDRIDFGQSLSVSAIQMAAAVNTIANGGVRIDPSLVEGRATTDSGATVGTGVATKHRVVSQNAAHQMMEMMERVVADGVGVAPAAKVPGYRVAGKTGTAQAVGANGLYDGTFTVSFAGFAPSDDPRFTVYVVVHNPRNGGGGGSVGGPAFSKIMGYALRRYGVPPTNTKPSTLPTEW